MMNRVTASGLQLRTTLRPSATHPLPHPLLHPLAIAPRHCPCALRGYATQHHYQEAASAETRRRAVTPFNDDGRVPWTQLSAGEKTARAAQQTFNLGMVVLGVALTGGVGYVLYSEVFAPDSKTTYFNRAVDRIRKDPRCLELLGDGKRITAFGEETHNKWRRARPIASTVTKDGQGNEHMVIQFNVQGPKGTGRVNMHLVRPAGQHEYQYKYFAVDVKGHQRIYLENADAPRAQGGEQKGFRLFGVKWS